ncbi:MAG: GIY-YIG nuclease family protein [Chloroflexi bacterium]|nr:GIY-YIG nuclease family protein [Chloroflexota bacterium]MDA1241150.1 GIY-YIG nuclease family protein [Chloroflexota bacterium]
MAFWVYILRCVDGSFYAGHTDNLERRFAEHERGEIPGYTATRLPVELAWSASAPTRAEALAFERRIKGWSRLKKQALIDGRWDLISARSPE